MEAAVLIFKIDTLMIIVSYEMFLRIVNINIFVPVYYFKANDFGFFI